MTLALLLVYALTAPRTVTFEDDGLFIMAAVDAGVAHPPGYPLYTLLGYLASWLPIGTPALRLHLLSGLLGGLACASLLRIARQADVPRLLALLAALAYGVSEHFWSQAIIAEVYTLNALLILLVWLLCAHALAAPLQARRQRAPVRAGSSAPRRTMTMTLALNLAALCFGLGLANHWPLMALAFPAFVILLWPRWRVIIPQVPRLLAIALGTAAALYLWMVWRSWQPGVVAFYGPLTTFEDFWYYVSRQGYGGVDASPSAGFLDKLGFAGYFLRECFFLYTPIGALLALAGCWRLWRRHRALLAASLWLYCAHSFLLILQLGFDYEYLNVAVFRPYPLVAYGVLAFWMAQGLAAAWEPLRDAIGRMMEIYHSHPPDQRHGWRWDIQGVAGLALAFTLAAHYLPISTLIKNHSINDRSQDSFAADYGQMILDGLAPNAVLFVVGDTTTAPLGYLHYAEGRRPDIELINTQGLVYPTRLFVPPTTQRVREKAFADYMRANTRPAYTINRNEEIPNAGGTVHYGFYQKLDPAGQAEAITLHFDPRVTRYFEALAQGPLPTDRWNRHQHSILLQQYGNFLGYTILGQDPQLKSIAEGKVQELENRYYGLVDMAEVLIEHGFNAEHLRIAGELLDKAEPLVDSTLSKAMQGRHHYRRGFLAYRLGDAAGARQAFARSVAAHDHPDNPSRAALDVFRPRPPAAPPKIRSKR